MADVKEAGNWRMPVLGDLNGKAMSVEEIREAVNEMKSGKALVLNEFPVECLKKGGMAVIEWLAYLWAGVVHVHTTYMPLYISPWLFNVYMDGMVRVVNDMVLGKWVELLSANGGGFEISQLLFADDTALVTDSEETLCKLVSEFGSVCERRKLRVNVGTSKVMRCSRYGNGGRMHVILNSEPFEEVGCVNHLGSQVAAGEGCERDVCGTQNE